MENNIVSSTNLYGGTYTLFKYTFAKFGIEVRFIDSSNPENFRNAADQNTKAFYTESIGNPKDNIDDFKKISEIAHSMNIPLIIDNTVAPFIFNPFRYGADIIIYSLTKFISGNGTSIGGAVIERVILIGTMVNFLICGSRSIIPRIKILGEIRQS